MDNSLSFAARTTLSLAISSIFLASAVQASSSHKPTETMVITASRSEASAWESPATIHVVGRDELDKTTHNSMAEMLKDIPGVELTDNGLAGRRLIRIRGEASSRVLILIDGQEVTYQRSGSDYGAGLLIDESSLERIEVVKGPYSVLYGSQAIGGVVNFVTRKGGNKPVSGIVKATYDSSTAGWQESATLYGSVDNFDYRISANYSDQGNLKTPDGRLDETDFRNNSQSLWLAYTLDDHKFGLSLDRYKLSSQTWSESAADMDEFYVRIPNLEREKIGFFYDYQAQGEYFKRLHFDAYQQTLSRLFRNGVTVVTPSGSPMIGDVTVNSKTASDDKQTTYGATLQANYSLPARNELVVGLQYRDDILKHQSDAFAQTQTTTGWPAAANTTTITALSNKSHQETWSVFAQNEWQFHDDWRWTLGARQFWVDSELNWSDKVVNGTATLLGSNSERESALITSTSLRYSGFDNTEWRLAYAQGFAAPTLVQIFMDTSAGGSTTYGNQDLKAERSNNLELGMRYSDNLWYLDSALYFAQAKDYIASVACNGEAVCNGTTNSSRSGNYYYNNIDKANTYGMELVAQYTGWEVSPYLSANFIRRQYDGASIKTWDTGEPSLTGRLGAKHSLSLDRFLINSDFYIAAASHAKNNTGDSEIRSAGWTTLNLVLNTEFGADDQFQANVGLYNLTNKRYTTAHEVIPGAGFSAALGLAWKF